MLLLEDLFVDSCIFVDHNVTCYAKYHCEGDDKPKYPWGVNSIQESKLVEEEEILDSPLFS